MVSFAEKVDLLDEYEKYWSAGAYSASSATCNVLAAFKMAEEEFPSSDEEAPESNVIHRWLRTRVPQKSDVESDDRLEYHFRGLLSHAPESPFDALEELLSGDERVQRLIDFIRNQSNLQFAQQLSGRLFWLYQAAKEEDPEEVPISPESLRNFIVFIQKTRNLRYPEVVLTPSNEIRAQWRTAPNRHFAVVFLPTGEARFVIFSPNRRDPDRIDRLSGITSVDTLMETAEPHGILEWASQ
jgi:hypothetical protein